MRTESDLGETVSKLREAGVKLEVGGHVPSTFVGQDLIVVSPGVSPRLKPIELARSSGIPVWSEIELAWRFLRGKLVAITGSNGKTTTTSLVSHILRTAGINTLTGGNIGVPLLSLVESTTDSTITVAEVSSFQLETIEKLRPDVGILLNLTPDHLDRHTSFEEYAAAKMRLFENQLDRDFAALNADDPEVTKRMPLGPQIVWFSRSKRVAQGAFLQGNQIMIRHEGSDLVVGRRDEVSLRGEHNLENVLAACAAAHLAGAAPADIAAGVKTFRGVEHRLELVGEIGGVEFYNDSKATNVDAALKAIEAFAGPLIVILGGKDKGSPYTPLREPLRRRARRVILIGAAAEKIASDLGDGLSIFQAGTLGRAVQAAKEQAQPGDVVLLAPACSSFDQFENYEHRGRVFKQLVEKFASESSDKSAFARKG
jgi:UDP-N-acetylmuramoylalanine--D-glutamate ligase